MRNKTFFKCEYCGKEWIVQRSETFSYLSPEWEDDSTKENPMTHYCRKCLKEVLKGDTMKWKNDCILCDDIERASK